MPRLVCTNLVDQVGNRRLSGWQERLLLKRGKRCMTPVFLLGRGPAFAGKSLDGALAHGSQPGNIGACQTLPTGRKIGHPGLYSAHAAPPFSFADASVTHPYPLSFSPTASSRK